ncbi:MAG TPA: DUF4398 domain-containing protein [Rhodanobacteraceae bacterium]|jgi:hypothetical protein|nr:DUF4398 domain-containing protein [Rhodanobacteraceae bacterium]
MIRRSPIHRFGLLFIAALAVSGTAAAVDHDTATLELTQAVTAVQAAERDDAARYAPTDLDQAHVLLDSAQSAADGRDWTDVAIYSERAKVVGDLASSRARQHRAEVATAEIQRTVDSLRQQLGGAP